MIYCIGNFKKYMVSWENHKTAGTTMKKLGRDADDKSDPEYPDGYPGGSVWKHYEDALTNAVKRSRETGVPYAVFGVEADWETETVPSKPGLGVDWHDLLYDRPIVLLEHHV